jgi:hypothetical protein
MEMKTPGYYKENLSFSGRNQTASGAFKLTFIRLSDGGGGRARFDEPSRGERLGAPAEISLSEKSNDLFKADSRSACI